MDNLQVILVVEDDHLIQSIVEESLTDGGFEIVIASSGKNALELLDASEGKYRALVTHINLGPGKVDGWDVARHAREIDPVFPVVYMSGKDSGEWASKGVPNSIMLAKPFAPAQLVTAVSQLSILNHRQRRSNSRKAMLQKTENPLRFVQFGDLHITDAGLQNHLDLQGLVEEVNGNTSGKIDFVYLPGDNADDGTPEQFRIVRAELSRLVAPWHAIPGDHNFKPRSLDNFYRHLQVRELPYVVEVSGCRCIFLDVVSRGTGGPDFQLGAAHLLWLRGQLDGARRAGKTAAMFMHTYPADLGEESAEVASMLDGSPVALVSMGHTHYNEISNDGRTVYAATRSTGQIEEGEVGFAFAAIDRGTVSWRFKPLQSSWPFVMITSPADRRLAIGPDSGEASIQQVRASAWGAVPIAQAELRIDDQPWQPMYDGDGGLFGGELAAPDGPFRLSVRVTDQRGNRDTDTIEVAVPADGETANRQRCRQRW